MLHWSASDKSLWRIFSCFLSCSLTLYCTLQKPFGRISVDHKRFILAQESKYLLANSVFSEGLVAIPLLVFISIAIHQTIYRLINTITSKSTILMIIALCYSVSLLFCIGATPHRLYNGGTVKVRFIFCCNKSIYKG